MSLKLEIIDLLEELYDYMYDHSDVDGDSEGFYPNREASLQQQISDVLFKLGSPNHDGGARTSVDPNHKRHEGPINENKKVVKITEADLRRIISEKLEGGVDEQTKPGFFGLLAKKGAEAARSVMGKGIQDGPLLKKGTQSGFNRVVSTMRTEVAQLLTKSPTIKISPKTIKVLEEPRYNVRVAFDLIEDVATVSGGKIRGEYSTILYRINRAKTELLKPAGQQLNMKQLMEDLYHVKDEIGQDLFKRPNLPQGTKELTAPLGRVNAAITHIETLFKTPDKPTSYLVKEEPKL